MADREFVERARRELSAEELSGLRAYQASTENGSVLFMPVIKRMGQDIRWTARVHLKGAAGPVPLNRASLRAIGAPDSWADKSRAFVETLEREYPAIPAAFPEQKALPGD